MNLHGKYMEEHPLKLDIPALYGDYLNFVRQHSHVTDDASNVDFNAVCVNRKPGDEQSVTGGNVRGKYWTFPTDEDKEEERLPFVDEDQYTEICPEFEGTYTEEVFKTLKNIWNIGRLRFLMKPPRSCLSWHRDPERRIHVPIYTNKGCRMIIEDEVHYMPANGNAFVTDNRVYHNFFNGGEENRIHLVATFLETDNNSQRMDLYNADGSEK